MTAFVINKSSLTGSLRIPGSKSHTLRAILFASLAEGKSNINAYLDSDDSLSMIEAVRSMGARVDIFPERLEITGTAGKIGPFEDVIQAGNSGIILRFLTALAAVSPHPFVITGDQSIRHQRPMNVLNQALQDLGATVTSLRGDGYAPLIIHGPLTNSVVSLEGQDSQPVSALLIASAFRTIPTIIHVENPGEIPWVGMTLDWFDRLGILYKNFNFQTFEIAGNSHYKGFDYTVPGDLSTAAFPIAAALMTHSRLVIENIDLNDSQGDKELIFVLQKMGASITIDHDLKSLTITPGSKLVGIEVDVNNFIDAVPILATLACFAEGNTIITGAAGARHKECDRLSCISTELQKMGGIVHMTAEGLQISKSTLIPADLYAHHDHRMALSLAVAAMSVEGISTIQGVECVNKTYPSFKVDFQRLGAKFL